MLNDKDIMQDLNFRKVHNALSMFGEANLNFELFKYALDIVFKEEKKKKEREQKKKEEEAKRNKKKSNAPLRLSYIALMSIAAISIIWAVCWLFKKKSVHIFNPDS